jgi:hypothetical protein
MTIDSTEAKIGRSIKKREITGSTSHGAGMGKRQLRAVESHGIVGITKNGRGTNGYWKLGIANWGIAKCKMQIEKCKMATDHRPLTTDN